MLSTIIVGGWISTKSSAVECDERVRGEPSGNIYSSELLMEQHADSGLSVDRVRINLRMCINRVMGNQ